LQPALHTFLDSRAVESDRQEEQFYGSATVLTPVGDHGALNATLPTGLQAVWIDRDLSWLDFNERVLAEALDERTPLLERAKFLAIFTSKPGHRGSRQASGLRYGDQSALR
jgi:hypothetical protein